MKRLYVVETKKEALDLEQMLPDGWRVVTPGARMGETVYDEVVFNLTRQPSHEALRWLYTSVLVKLKPALSTEVDEE